jgi:hypothetical protein
VSITIAAFLLRGRRSVRPLRNSRTRQLLLSDLTPLPVPSFRDGPRNGDEDFKRNAMRAPAVQMAGL